MGYIYHWILVGFNSRESLVVILVVNCNLPILRGILVGSTSQPLQWCWNLLTFGMQICSTWRIREIYKNMLEGTTKLIRDFWNFRVLKAPLIHFYISHYAKRCFYIYIYTVHTVSPPCRTSFLLTKTTPWFFWIHHFLGSGWKAVAFSFVQGPRRDSGFGAKAPEVNFGTKVGKAPTTPWRRRHKGDRMEMGRAPWKKKHGEGFPRKVWWFCRFFWVQIIDFSYSYKLPVKLWRDFWGHLTLQQQNIRAYD